MRILALLAALLTAPAFGTAHACGVALVLAMDVSGSVNREEYGLQMDGLADALGDPLVQEALVSARARLALVQWSGYSRQRVSIPWTAIEEDADVARLRRRVAGTERAFRNYATAIGEVLEVSVDLLAEDAVAACTRRVIDVSGDGATNEGKRPVHVHARLAAAGIVVNGLAIRGSEADIVAHFREKVIFGPNAFVEIADGYEDYPRAIRRKLISELAQQVAGNDSAIPPFSPRNNSEEETATWRSARATR